MKGKYMVAVIGGACAGSEATQQFTDKGIEVVVFDQKLLPYGKIEDGLPRWHVKLRQRELENIESKIDHSLVHFVPLCKLGEHIQIQELIDLGFSLVIIANGAWRDRILQVEGLDKIEDHSFVYQNNFIYWFNHYQEHNYQDGSVPSLRSGILCPSLRSGRGHARAITPSGPAYEVKGGAVVIGGGLASIDVVKACQLLATCNRLRQMGIETDVISLEQKGIPKLLEENKLAWEDIELKPATLYYRRNIARMPLASPPPNATPEQIAKVEKVRQKIVDNACAKYLFDVRELHLPVRIHNKSGSVAGITFKKTKIVDNQVVTTDEEVFAETQFIVSSIGSIPEPLPGIRMLGELYDIVHEQSGRFRQFRNVFGVGNAITGKGNIQASLKHSRCISQFLAGCLTSTEAERGEMIQNQEESIREEMREVAQCVAQISPLSDADRQRILQRIQNMQTERGFENYLTWRDNVRCTI